MDINLHQLRIFHAVARHLSYTRAAEELLLSQPAVSLQVKELERGMGIKLFEQIGKRIFLTDAGAMLFAHTKRLLEMVDQTRDLVNQIKGLQRGSLRVAASTTVGIYVIPKVLGIFHQRYPDVTISLDVSNRAHVHQRLMHNEVDLAVLERVPSQVELVVENFLPDELVVVASPEHPLSARSGPIAREELATETFLVREEGSGTRESLDRFSSQLRLGVTAGLELGSNGAIKQAVMAGLGLAVLSSQTIQLELELGYLALLPVEGFPIQRHWHIVHLREKHLSAPAVRFKQALLDYRDANA